MNRRRSECPYWCDKQHPYGCGHDLHELECECSHLYLVGGVTTLHGAGCVVTVEVRFPAHQETPTARVSLGESDHPVELDARAAGQLSALLEVGKRAAVQLNTDPDGFEPLHLTERS